MLRSFRGLAPLALVFLAACGTGGMADPEASANGQELFTQKCGTCHELQAAGTRGNPEIRAPSLDAAFAAPREEGYDETSIREVVLGQMRYPIPPMPEPEQLFPSPEYSEAERQEAMEAVATYVASVAANEQAIAQAREQRGAQGASDPRALFTGNCASCHTLSDAGSRGTVGPNLDRTTMDVDGIERQIREGGGGMPPFEGTLSDEQIQALTKYVAESSR